MTDTCPDCESGDHCPLHTDPAPGLFQTIPTTFGDQQ